MVGRAEAAGGGVAKEEVREVRGGKVVQGFVGGEEDLEVDALLYGEPVELTEDGCDVFSGSG